MSSKKKKKSEVTTDCQTPADQIQSFQGRWLPIWSFQDSSEPITVTVDDSAPAALVAAAAEAVSRWNAHFSNFKMNVIDLRQGTAPGVSSCCGANSSSILMPSLIQFAVDSGAKRSVGIHFLDLAAWQSRYGASDNDVLAYTEHSFVSKNGHPMNHVFKNSIIAVNAKFFVNAATFDIVSVLTHELGHLLGLKHSCNQAEGLPDCETAPDDYWTASLFPAFAPGEVRSQLNTNDQGRINCVYGPSAIVPQ